jgi:hypothetical protein
MLSENLDRFELFTEPMPNFETPNIEQKVFDLMKAYEKIEEEVVKKVLRKILQREPTERDIKLLAIITDSVRLGEYIIQFKDIQLGRIKRKYWPDNLGVEFIPDPIFNNSKQ